MIQRHRPFLAYWDWQQHARCRGMDSSVFSPSGEQGAEAGAGEEGPGRLRALPCDRGLCLDRDERS